METLEELTRLFKLHKHLGTDKSQKLDTTQRPVQLGTHDAVVMNPLLGNVFTITPTDNIALTPTSQVVGIYSIVILTSGTTPYTISFQTGFTATATFTTPNLSGRYFTITFVCDGVNFREVARTAAMLPS